MKTFCGTLFVMCELGYSFLHIFRISFQNLIGKKKIFGKEDKNNRKKEYVILKMFCTKILVKKMKTKGK